MLVNETLAKTFFPRSERRRPAGEAGSDASVPWFTIVGVVRDVKQGGIASKTGTELYFLADQGPTLGLGAPAA